MCERSFILLNETLANRSCLPFSWVYLAVLSPIRNHSSAVSRIFPRASELWTSRWCPRDETSARTPCRPASYTTNTSHQIQWIFLMSEPPGLHQASAMTLAILFSLKTIESLQNGVATYFQATPLFSMRTVSLVSSQSCCSVDADAQCKRGLGILLA